MNVSLPRLNRIHALCVRLSGVCAVALVAGTLARAAAPEPSYKPAAHFAVSGSAECSGVKLDPSTRRLYVATGDTVTILDADSGSSVGSIATPGGASALALAPDLGRGFAANSAANAVTIFDLKSGAAVKTVALTGRTPVALWYDASARIIYVVDQGSGDVTALAAASGEIVGSIALGGKLTAVTGNGYGQIYVADADRNVLHVVATSGMISLGDDPVAPGVGPSGLSIDPSGRRIFVSCANGKIPVVDSDAGFVFTVMDSGQGGIASLFDRSKVPPAYGDTPWKARIFIVATDGTLSVLRMNAFINYSFHDNVKIPEGARAVAFDAKTNRVFVSLPHEILVLGR